MKMSRRKFLIAAASVGGGAALSTVMQRFEPLNAEALSNLTNQAEAGRTKWVFLIDVDRCNGCMKCTEGCIADMHVPPAWGDPQYEGRQPWIQVFKQEDGTFLPVLCQNCQNAPCVKVCPVGATYYNEDHVVLIDQNRCIGCRMCMAACPYERRFFNWFDPPVTEEEKRIPYSPDYNIPHRRGVVEKCVWCRHRIKDGKVPACVEACTKAGMKAIWFGDAAEDAVSDGEEVVPLSAMLERRGAFRLRAELGTEPSVIYLPAKGA